MRVLLRVFLVVKAVTPRSALSPQRMAVGAVVVALALPLPAMAEEEAVSGQKAIRPTPRQLTARAEVVMVVYRQA